MLILPPPHFDTGVLLNDLLHLPAEEPHNSLSMTEHASDLHSLLRFYEKRDLVDDIEADDNLNIIPEKIKKYEHFQLTDSILEELEGDEEFDGEIDEDLIDSRSISEEWSPEKIVQHSVSVSPLLSLELPASPESAQSSFKFIETDELTKNKIKLVLESEFDREIEERLQDLTNIESKLQSARTILMRLNTCVGYRQKRSTKRQLSRRKKWTPKRKNPTSARNQKKAAPKRM